MPILMDVKNAGFVGLLLLMLGVVGFLLAVVSFVLSLLKQRAAFVVGLCSLALAALIFGTGALGTVYGRYVTDRALGSGAVSKVLVEKITRVGYDEAKSASKLGLIFGIAPFLAGALAAFVGATRRKDDSDPYAAPGQTAAPEGGSIVAPAIVVGLDLMVAAGPLLLMLSPLPGRAWAMDDPTWDLLEAAEAVTNPSASAWSAPEDDEPGSISERSIPKNDLTKPCARLKAALLEPGARAADVPELAVAQTRCSEVVTKKEEPVAPKAEGTAEGSLGLDPIGNDVHPKDNENAVPPLDEGQTPVKAGIKPGQANVSGRLAPEVIRRIVRRNINQIKFCYEKSLKTNPTLEGTINVRFVIGQDGSVKTANAQGSSFPDPSVTSCVTKVIFRMQFPQPEGGIVTVSYPFVFKPGT